jgi:hypothetical protein
MFDINRQPLITEVRCRECRAILTVDSDHHPTIERSIAKFQARHHHPVPINNNQLQISIAIPSPAGPLPGSKRIRPAEP